MERIGRYRIIGELGRGAMGVVYHAVDPSIGRSVAIKTIRIREINNTAQRESLRARLFREARSAGVLSHPNIVTIYDMDEVDGLAYIAMAFVNGPTLDKILGSDQPLSGAVMLRILRQTAAALDYAHGKGIIHRDIKPANIMTDEDGAAKITDFGIAKLTGGGHTETKTISGTPNYMSPEQVQGLGIDGRSDQFSLAVIAYEILTGERPFTGEALGTVVYRIVSEQPAAAYRLNGTLTQEIDSVLQQALSKNPADRFGTCSQFVAALEKACGESRGWKTVAANTASFSPTLAAAAGIPSFAPKPTPRAPASRASAALLETEDAPAGSRHAPASKFAGFQAFSTAPERSVWIPVLVSLAVVAALVGVLAAQLGWRPMERSKELVSAWQSSTSLNEKDAASRGSFASRDTQPETDTHVAGWIAEGEKTVKPDGPAPPVVAALDENALDEKRMSPGALPPAKTDVTTPRTSAALAAEAMTESNLPPEARFSAGSAAVTSPSLALKPIVSSPAIYTEDRDYRPAHPLTLEDLWISSNPAGAKAVLDDNLALTCLTPCTLKAPAGRHRVMVSMGGFISETREVVVEDNAIDIPPVTLRQPNGSVIVMTTPNGAYLRVDGQLLQGRTPATLSLAPGDHIVSVEHGGQSVEKRFDIQAGSLKPWTVSFPQ